MFEIGVKEHGHDHQLRQEKPVTRLHRSSLCERPGVHMVLYAHSRFWLTGRRVGQGQADAGALPDRRKVHARLSVIIEPMLKIGGPERLDDLRYKQRFPTRAAAIKCLLDSALKEKPVPPEPEA